MPAKSSHAQVVRFMLSRMRPHAWFIAAVVVLNFVSAAFTLAQPYFYKLAIDAVAYGTIGDRAVLLFASKMVIFGVLCAVVMIIADQAWGAILGWVETRMMKSVHMDVFRHVQRLSSGFHVNEFAGSTARKIGRGVDSVEGFMDRIWLNFFHTIVLVIGLLIVLAFYALPIAVAIIVGLSIYCSIAITLNIKLGSFYTWTDRQDTRVTGSLVDAISSNAVVKSFAAETREDARHDTIVKEWQRRQWKAWIASTAIVLTQFILLMSLECTVLLLAVRLWYTGQLTAGDFIMLTFYVGQLWFRFFDIGRHMRDYLRSVAHLEEMVQMYSRPLAVTDSAEAKPLIVNKGAINFNNVGFRYENQTREVFKNFTVSIKPGEKIALVGHSGGGKSTFVKLLLRLYDVTSGSIEIDGQNISMVTQESLRSNVALVPQDPILFHRSLAENIAYGKPDGSIEEIERAAKLAHAYEFVKDLPKKYETLVGERGIKLSGGERQRVAIARAILADRPILVLDEATSSLDSLSESYIQDALETLMKGRTTIVIAHRLSTIKKVDRILVIENGSIVEHGTHDELLKRDSGIYKELYNLQAGGFLGE